MKKILESAQDVETHLGLMRIAASPSISESEFHSLVWKKINSPCPLQWFPQRPAIAFACLLCLIIYGLWVFQYFAVPAHQGPARKPSLRLSGMVLEAKGEVDFAGEAVRHGRGLWQELAEGETISTGRGSSAILYFPGAGYVYVAESSQLSMLRAAKEIPEKKAAYELALESGTVYSKLGHLEGGSVFRYGTPFGRAEVTGTDFSVSSGRETGMRVDVLRGEVNVEAIKRPGVFEKIEKGGRAWIRAEAEGIIYVTSISQDELGGLGNAFDHIFHGAVIHADRRLSGSARNFRIVSRKEK